MEVKSAGGEILSAGGEIPMLKKTIEFKFLRLIDGDKYRRSEESREIHYVSH